MADSPATNMTPVLLTPVHRYTPGGGTVVTYQMRAWHTGLLLYVFWTSNNAPDPTGASSGYAPGDLTGIVWLGVG